MDITRWENSNESEEIRGQGEDLTETGWDIMQETSSAMGIMYKRSICRGQ